MEKKRLYWIDWMKVIGIYFIIAGHIFPLGHEYIYVFSVPLFFVISGYLGHRESSSRLFWSKLFRNLILPCIVILLILHTEQTLAQIRLGLFAWINIPTHIINCLIGSLALHTATGKIATWIMGRKVRPEKITLGKYFDYLPKLFITTDPSFLTGKFTSPEYKRFMEETTESIEDIKNQIGIIQSRLDLNNESDDWITKVYGSAKVVTNELINRMAE